MGILGATAMASTPCFTLLLTVIAAVVISESQAYNVDRNPFIVERRGYRDPDDPRNLFAAMYGANFKRSDPEMGTLPELTPEMFEYLKSLVQKRGRGLGTRTTQGTSSIPSTGAFSVVEVLPPDHKKLNQATLTNWSK